MVGSIAMATLAQQTMIAGAEESIEIDY